MKKLLFVLTILVLVTGIVFAGGSQSTLQRIQRTGKLVLGTSADYPPYEFVIMQNGQPTIVGFDIEIAGEIARDLSAHLGREVTLDIRDIGFDGLLQALNSNRVDIVIAGMTPTPERMESVDFSIIYYRAEQGIMIRAEDRDRFTTLESLAGRTIGAQLATTQEGIAQEDLPNSRLVSLGRIPDLVLELQNRRIDALIIEKPVAEGYVRSNPDLMIAPMIVGDEDAGSAVAIRKGNQDLVDLINTTLRRLMNDGSIDRFVAEANLLVDNQ